MWFGVAPAPAPSPRTNTKAWHPPHCTCARHSGGGGASLTIPTSPGRSDAGASASSPRAVVRVSPRRAAAPISASDRSAGRKMIEISSSRDRGSSTRKATKLDAFRHHTPSIAETVRSMAEDATQRVHRLSRRLSRRLSVQNDSADGAAKDDHPEREEFPLDNNDAVAANWPRIVEWNRPRSRGATATGFSRPTSSIKSALCHPDAAHRLASPSSLLSIPAPTKSRRGSRGGQSRTSDRVHLKPLHAISAIATEYMVHLSPPMAECAQPANLVGHTSSVGVVLVDDDNFIVSCSIDGSVKVWSRRTFDCLYTLYGHDDAVSSVDLSPRWLVSGSHDTTLRVYESGHGFRFVHVLEGHTGHVTRVVLLGKENFVLSGSDDASLRLWDVESGGCIAVFASHASRITCLLVLPNHPYFCSGSADASVCFWDLNRAIVHQDAPSSHAAKSFRVHKATVQCLLSSGDFVYSCSNDGTIQWFDARSLQHLGCVDSVHSPVYSMALHPSLGFLVCSTGDGRLLVYSNLSQSTIAKRELKVAPTWISSLQLLRGKLLACASEDQLYIVNLERPRIECVLATAHGFLNCVRWLEPEQLATSGEDNVVKIWPIH